jgi:hypothetical protein
MAVCNAHDLGAFAAFGFSDAAPPFWRVRCAGAFRECLADLHLQTDGQVTTAIDEVPHPTVSGKAHFLISSMSENSHALKRIALMFDRKMYGRFRISRSEKNNH